MAIVERNSDELSSLTNIRLISLIKNSSIKNLIKLTLFVFTTRNFILENNF